MRILQILFQNAGYKLTAIAVAVVLWAAAQGFQSVEVSLDLPIGFDDTPEDLVVVGQSVSEVNVKIAGSRAALRWVTEDLQRFPISLKRSKAGTTPIVLDAERLEELLPRGADVIARSPSNMTVDIETVVRKRVPITADVVGEPAGGRTVASVKLRPSEIVLAGARSRLRQVKEVRTSPIDVSEVTETTSREVSLIDPPEFVWRPDSEPVSIEIRVTTPDGTAGGSS